MKLKKELDEIRRKRAVREKKYTSWRERMLVQRNKRLKDREAAARVLEEVCACTGVWLTQRVWRGWCMLFWFWPCCCGGWGCGLQSLVSNAF